MIAAPRRESAAAGFGLDLPPFPGPAFLYMERPFTRIAASRRVTSLRPSGRTIGSSKARRHYSFNVAKSISDGSPSALAAERACQMKRPQPMGAGG
jgi:hypothetical protein